MKINYRKIFVISIIAICIICINIAIFLTITQKDETVKKENKVIVDTVALSENFENIFDNKLDNQDYNVKSVSKQDNTKDIIYTGREQTQKQEGKFDVNVKIPYINVNHANITGINQEIQSIFYSKVNDILTQTGDSEMIYSVKYKAYINDNILSLIISSNLREGNKPQRVIIKTYNYNLSSNEVLDINEVLDYRAIDKKTVQTKINTVIKEASQTASSYQQLGYNKFLRDANDEMYKIENSKVFFLGQDKAMYILYPYGNSSYTSEVDLIVI